MISAVLDTNVLVSGLGWRDSVPGRIVDALLDGRFVAITSLVLVDELRRVLDYPRLREHFADPGQVVSLIAEVSVVVEPSSRVEAVATDADNRLLEVASAAGAHFVVTGDREILALEGYRGSRIVSPRAFLDLLSG